MNLIQARYLYWNIVRFENLINERIRRGFGESYLYSNILLV